MSNSRSGRGEPFLLNSLVGYTGFVGSNISKSYAFDNLYNSKNISEAFGTSPDLLVFAGIKAEKYIANKNPQEDYAVIENAIENIKKINAKKVVLISTIDVYKNPVNVDEDTIIDTENLQPYGLNRYYFENQIREHCKEYTIVRLPGLYGENIKKNFIFDLINVIPFMLNEEKFNELSDKNNNILKYYTKQDNGFYRCNEINIEEKIKLKKIFENLGFSALNFTDSRGRFQFFNLKYLWTYIEKAQTNNIKTLNMATEPIVISELHEFIKNSKFINEIASEIPNYDFKTKYSELLGGKNGYIFEKKFVLNDIKKFVENMNGKIQ